MVKKKKYMTAWTVLLIILTALFAVGVMTVGYVIGTRNSFVVAQQDLQTQFHNIETEYQRRADLIPNLVEVVKGYATHEQTTLTDVIAARNQFSANYGKNVKERMVEMGTLDSAISRLLVVVEQYPNLKAIDQFNALTEELTRTENRIQVGRSDYNKIVRSYNIRVMTFPANLIAAMFDFSEKEYFTDKPYAEEQVKVDFNKR